LRARILRAFQRSFSKELLVDFAVDFTEVEGSVSFPDLAVMVCCRRSFRFCLVSGAVLEVAPEAKDNLCESRSVVDSESDGLWSRTGSCSCESAIQVLTREAWFGCKRVS